MKCIVLSITAFTQVKFHYVLSRSSPAFMHDFGFFLPKGSVTGRDSSLVEGL